MKRRRSCRGEERLVPSEVDFHSQQYIRLRTKYHGVKDVESGRERGHCEAGAFQAQASQGLQEENYFPGTILTVSVPEKGIPSSVAPSRSASALSEDKPVKSCVLN